MLTVHHLNNSRSQRVLWAFEELGVPFELVRYQRDSAMRAPEALREVHPLGLSPVLTDGQGLVLAETGAVLTWLLEHHDPDGLLRVAPEATAWSQYLYWTNAAEGTAMPPLVMGLVMSEMARRAPFVVRPLARAIRAQLEAQFYGPQIRRVLDLAERDVAATGWFAGDRFSAADVMMSFPVEAAHARQTLGNRPALTDWLARVHARPAYKAALARGGKYDYA